MDIWVKIGKKIFKSIFIIKIIGQVIPRYYVPDLVFVWFHISDFKTIKVISPSLNFLKDVISDSKTFNRIKIKVIIYKMK